MLSFWWDDFLTMLRYYPLWIDLCNSMVIYPCISVVFMYFHVFIIRILLFLISATSLSNITSMTDEEPIDQIVHFLNGIDLSGVSIFLWICAAYADNMPE